MREVANFMLRLRDVGESGTPKFVNLGRGVGAGMESGKAEGESGGRGGSGREKGRSTAWSDSAGEKELVGVGFGKIPRGGSRRRRGGDVAGRGNNGGGSFGGMEGCSVDRELRNLGCVRKFDGVISWLAAGWSRGELNSAGKSISAEFWRDEASNAGGREGLEVCREMQELREDWKDRWGRFREGDGGIFSRLASWKFLGRGRRR